MELTSEIARIGYLAVLGIGLGFFALQRRRFDFLPVAYLGVAFYFLPLVSGHVLQSSAYLSSSIQPAVYFIALAFLLVLITAAAIVPGAPEPANLPSSSAIAGPLVVLSACGLVGALVQSGGSVIQYDKVKSLQQIGIFYVLFETAASLACVAAVVERRWYIAIAAIALLAIDLLAGFRNYATLTTLSVGVVLLSPQGQIRLYRKALTYGASFAAVVLTMLFLHSARSGLFGIVSRSDTIQFQEARSKSALIKRMIEQSEPYIIQATLVAAVETGLSCRPSNILKSAWLLVPPGMRRFAPTNPYPATFYEEYQPILYPRITYGTAGNIWAEMLCRFGAVGPAVFAIVLVLLLLWLGRLLVTTPTMFLSPIAFSGVILAFYIHRNDLNYTLVMIRQTAYVFLAAYFLLRLKEKIVSLKKPPPPAVPMAGGGS